MKDFFLNKKKKHLKRISKLKIRYKINCVLGRSHDKFLRKNNVFGMYGDNILYQPDTIPNNPKLIRFHNNIKVASGVIFYEHDVINQVFVNMDRDVKYVGHLSAIEVFDNVFIGGKSIIIGNVKIGPNAIIGAGSVVTKDVPEGTIVAGNPARVIGSFEELHKKRKMLDTNKENMDYYARYDEIWKNFSVNNK